MTRREQLAVAYMRGFKDAVIGVNRGLGQSRVANAIERSQGTMYGHGYDRGALVLATTKADAIQVAASVLPITPTGNR